MNGDGVTYGTVLLWCLAAEIAATILIIQALRLVF